MAIVLLAIIGAKIDAGTAYWICFGIFCCSKLYNAFRDAIEEMR